MKKVLSVVVSLLLLLSIAGCDTTLFQEEVQKGVENVVKEDSLLFSELTSTMVKNNEYEILPSKYLDKIQVYFFDVGQADSVLIVTPNKDAILIDAGDKGAADIIINKLKEIGVEDIDLVIATHPHSDHIGGLQGVIESYDAVEIIMSSYITTTRTFENLLNVIEKQGKGVTQAKAGLTREIDGIEITVISVDTVPDDCNNSSVVFKVDYGEVGILFTGDIEEEAEELILSSGSDIESDVLKIAHHGSSTSTTDRFLDRVNPKLAVISVGKDNKYNHPSELTIDKLLNRGIAFYRTDEDGTVMLETDGVDIIASLSTSILQSKPKSMMRSIPDNDDIEVAKVEIVEEVFIIKDENIYHRKNGCEGLKGSTERISIDLVRLMGLIECSLCTN